MRPYIIVNVAVSADGKLSTRERRQVKISGKQDFERVDQIKAGCDAIMVGIGTVLADNPSLTVKSPELIEKRLQEGRPEHPVRIVVDSQARTPTDAKILHKGSGVRIIAVAESAPSGKISDLEKYADVFVSGESRVDLKKLMEYLTGKGIQRLMVEGGGTLIWGMIAAGLVDELTMFMGNIIIGGKDAPTLADGAGYIKETEFPRLQMMGATPMEEGVLIHWRVKQNLSN